MDGGIYDVPIVGTLAKAATWIGDTVIGAFADVAAGVILGFMGLEKPANQDSTTHVTRIPYPDLTHCDVLDESVPMTHHRDGRVASAPECVIMDKTDEMSMDFLVVQPSMVNSFAFTNTSPTITIPCVPNYTPWYASSGYYTITNLAYIAAAFRYWRGSLRYRLNIVSCNFMQARIMIRLIPNGGFASGAYAQDLWTQIIDVQGSTNLDFTVPFISSDIWLQLADPKNPVDLVTAGQYTTRLEISYISPLSSPDPTLNCPLYINVFVAGGSDTQFRWPKQPVITPYSTLTSVSKTQWSAQKEFCKPFPPFHPSLSTSVVEDLNFGDAITTIRNFLHTYTPDFQMTLTPAVSAPNYLQTVQFQHSAIPGCAPNPVTVNLNSSGATYLGNNAYISNLVTPGGTAFGPSVLCVPLCNLHPTRYWGALYHNWRGSMRYKYVCPTSQGNTSMLAGSDLLSNGQTGQGVINLTDTSVRNVLEFATTFLSPLLWHKVGTGFADYMNLSGLNVILGWAAPAANTIRIFNVYSATGDDFLFTYWHGPPVVTSLPRTLAATLMHAVF
jgi:hypothetical protein